jgi:chloride channel protein, CIC family
LPRPRLRLLVACGAAAGISAAYNAPIAGALFVAEIVLRSFAFETLGPLIVASVVGNLTAHHFLGFKPLYEMPVFELNLGLDVVSFALLGVMAGLVAPIFLICLQAAKRPFKALEGMLWLKLGMGGLAVGAISVLEPAVWGNGYSAVNAILGGHWVWQGLLVIFVLKVLATSLATGSGAVGGVFTPTLFVGAALGGLFGVLLQALWPQAVPLPAYVAAGMGAFLAACSHAPLMSAVMIFEMTDNPRLIVPLLVVCVLSLSIKRLLWQPSLYSHSLPVEQPSLIAASAMAKRLLRGNPPTISDNARCGVAEAAFLRSRWQNLYVIDGAGRFCGALSLHDFGPYLRSGANAEDAIPRAMVRRDHPRVGPEASLGEMMEAFSQHRGERLPVVDAGNLLHGYVSKTDLMLALQETSAQHAD